MSAARGEPAAPPTSGKRRDPKRNNRVGKVVTRSGRPNDAVATKDLEGKHRPELGASARRRAAATSDRAAGGAAPGADCVITGVGEQVLECTETVIAGRCCHAASRLWQWIDLI